MWGRMARRHILNQQIPAGCPVMEQAVVYGEILLPFPALRPATQQGWDAQQMSPLRDVPAVLRDSIHCTALQHEKQQEIFDFLISGEEKDQYCQEGISLSSLGSLRSPPSCLPSTTLNNPSFHIPPWIPCHAEEVTEKRYVVMVQKEYISS